MIDHDRALESAAAALDFGLSAGDDAALAEHLASCATCRATVTALNDDAAALTSLDHEDAPAGLRERIMAATPPAAAEVSPSPDRSRTLITFPKRYHRPALIAAAAAVAIAVVGLTLPWRNTPSAPDGGMAVAPSARPSDRPSPPGSARLGEPSSAPGDDLVTAHEQVAQLTADDDSGGVVDLGTNFRLAALGGRSATELAERLTVQPRIAMTTTVESDGRVRLTPTEPLTPGVVYRFSLVTPDGSTDSWAFQARQPLRVVSTLPYDTSTEVPLDTGIEVTFDQDGVVDAADHVSIEPKVAGRFEQHGRVLAFVPERLSPATIYTVTVSRGVRVEATGEILEKDVRFRFETDSTSETRRPETFFRFSNDLFESATAERPVVSLWWFTDGVEGEPSPTPDAVRLEVFRFRDRAAAIGAFKGLRDLPRWSRHNGAERIPTAGLQHVAGLDAPLQDANGALWTALPEAMPAGWYLVEHPSEDAPAQAIVQVTDLAAYLAVSGTRSVVWANDLSRGGPVAGATVEAEGTRLGRTDANGLLMAKTPASLLPDDTEGCVSGCAPVITVTAGLDSAFLPATGAANPDGKGTGFEEYFDADADPRYWLTFDTDRVLYRRTDTVHAWGMVRDRASKAVPATVTLRLVDQGGDIGIPITLTQSTPRSTGVFAGSLELRDVPEGEYRLELVVGGDVVSQRDVRVDRILKPAYRIDVETGRRVYVVGDRIRISATASFYEGTPVPGVPLRLDGLVGGRATTDRTGTAIVRTTARWIQDSRDEPDYTIVRARPARAEEGDILGASHDIVIFPSSWVLSGDATVRGGRVRISGFANMLDRDRMEREIAAGAPVWGVDPAGKGVRGRTVQARIVEQIPQRMQIGTSYDFIAKKVVPVYEYDFRERSVGTLRLVTSANGRITGSIAAPDPKHSYRVELSVADPDGLRATTTAWATEEIDVEQADQSPWLAPTRPGVGDAGIGVGETLDLTMREPGVTDRVADGAHLFVSAQAGIREATAVRSDRFVTTFPDWGPPNVSYGAVRFTGRGYVTAASYRAGFRVSDRAMRITLTTDRARYAPGGTVRLSIRTVGPDGRPMPASVVLRAVDEKLFSIGGAFDDDPQSDLYRWLPSGVRATYVTHRGPSAPFEGGDTTGGGGDDAARDAILFRAVDTDRTGRASLTVALPSDHTSWRVSASAVGAGLEAGRSSIQVPVGSPFFVDASIAPEYLASDRPAIQVRGFGSALQTGDRIRFTVESGSLGLHKSGLAARAFQAVTVPLPKLSLGRHRITITGRTGSGASARRHTITRSIDVVASRLSRTRIAYDEPGGPTRIERGGELTELIVSDAGIGPQLAMLHDLAGGGTARLESALAADIAASVLAERAGDDDASAGITTFDGATYQREDGGLAVMPYAASDLDVSVLAALAAPERFSQSLRIYLDGVAGAPKETRERRNLAIAGLAGMGDPVMPKIRSALADGSITIRERLMLAIGAARLGDLTIARATAAELAQRHGESLGATARLRVGDDVLDTTTGSALMAMLLAATGDPVAPRYWAFVGSNPTDSALFDLHAAAYARWMVDRSSPAEATFAYTVGGARHVVELAPGDTFSLRLTKAQRATFSIEPIDGRIGVTQAWREPIRAASIGRDPDIKVTRTVRPAGTIPSADLVVVDLRVRFGPHAPAGCHRVTDLLPSGLVPVGSLRGWVDPETGEPTSTAISPDAQVGQRVIFCAEPTRRQRSLLLRYVARVISIGTYRWEPVLVESRTDPNRAAIVPPKNIRIR